MVLICSPETVKAFITSPFCVCFPKCLNIRFMQCRMPNLVARFAKVFGTFATDVSKQAVADILIDIPVEDVPNGLK